jgi:hypothetical protein
LTGKPGGERAFDIGELIVGKERLRWVDIKLPECGMIDAGVRLADAKVTGEENVAAEQPRHLGENVAKGRLQKGHIVGENGDICLLPQPIDKRQNVRAWYPGGII